MSNARFYAIAAVVLAAGGAIVWWAGGREDFGIGPGIVIAVIFVLYVIHSFDDNRGPNSGR